MELSIPYIFELPWDGAFSAPGVPLPAMRFVLGNSDTARADPDWIGYLDPERGIAGLLDGTDLALSASDLTQADGIDLGPSWRGQRAGTINGMFDPNRSRVQREGDAAKMRRFMYAATRQDAIMRWTPTADGIERLLRVRNAGRPDTGGRQPTTYQLTFTSEDAVILSGAQAASTSINRYNYVLNPSGESVAKWTSPSPDYTTTREASGVGGVPSVYGGFRDKHTFDGAATPGFPFIDLMIPTVPAAGTYVASVYLWIPAAWNGGAPSLTPTNAGVGIVSTTAANLALRDQWQRINTVYTVTAGGLSGNLRLAYPAGTPPTTVAGGLLYSDALQVEVDVLHTYFDGSTSDGAWTGGAHNSTSVYVGQYSVSGTNLGDAPTWGWYEILGPVTNPTLFAGISQMPIQLTITVPAGEKLWVFPERAAIFQEGPGPTFTRTDKFDAFIGGGFEQLPRGYFTVILDPTFSGVGASLTVHWRHAWP